MKKKKKKIGLIIEIDHVIYAKFEKKLYKIKNTYSNFFKEYILTL